jgi:hypothetical protein
VVGVHFAKVQEQSFCTLFDLRASVTLVQGLERVAHSTLTWYLDQVPPRDRAGDSVTSDRGRPGEAVVSLGSSLSNPTTEYLLSRTLGVFSGASSRRLTEGGLRCGRFFCFVWDVPPAALL